MHAYSSPEQLERFRSALLKLNDVMEEVQKSREDDIISSIKERV